MIILDKVRWHDSTMIAMLNLRLPPRSTAPVWRLTGDVLVMESPQVTRILGR